MNPRYPIYVISKGRWESRLTAKNLDEAGISYRIVVEPQELEQYAAVIDRRKILALPFSDLGQGSIPARNWVWEHSIGEGHARHWILDDNIDGFYRFNRNLKVKVNNGSTFAAAEDFTDRYANVPMSGMNYFMFVTRKAGNIAPVTFNTRVYSCILLSNEVPHRWRGRYNEDTDLSLRFLKDGYCTILFNAFLALKQQTMTMRGGNTTDLYGQGGRLEMARSLQRQHPDIVSIAWKWGHWQHQVDYRRFKRNKLILREDAVIPEGVDDYGMRLLRVEPKGRLIGLSTAHDDTHKVPLRERLGYEHVGGGGVPGGHNVISDGVRKPFITPMRECNSIELRHDDVVADIGAYCGTYAIRCARFPVRLVRAYEPSPVSFKMLSLTHLRNMELINAAVVGDDRASADFYLSKKTGVTNSLVPSRAKDKITVQAVSYDEAVRNASIVKIDVEGGEYNLGSIVRPSVRALIIDFHPVGEGWIGKADAIIEEVRSAGFKTIIEPNWENGWTRAGSWVREISSDSSTCEDLMSGRFCCGCSAPLAGGQGISLCEECWAAWSKQHRSGYTRASRSINPQRVVKPIARRVKL